MRRAAARSGGLAAALSLIALLSAGRALAAPVTIDFESGLADNEAVTNQYHHPPLGGPAGPDFSKTGEETNSEDFKGLKCGPPYLDGEDPAHSGTHSLKLEGCPGGEFTHSAAFFHMGYETERVEFWVAVKAATLSIEPVITTAFNIHGEIIMQEETLLPPQSEPTYKPVVVESGKGNIAYVAVELGEKGKEPSSATGVLLAETSRGSKYLLVDDLTYYPPASPPEATFLLGASPPKTTVAAGDHVAVKIPVTWTNNPEPSSTPVELEASTPEGVEASFSENPSSSGNSTLTLNVAKNAEPGPVTITVSGYVERGGPHEKKASVKIPVTINEPFFVDPMGSWILAPCTPQQLPLRVETIRDFSQPLTLEVDTHLQSGVTITGISGGEVLDASHAVTTVSPQNGLATATLTVEARLAESPARSWVLRASASGYPYRGNTGTIATEAGHVSKVTSNGVPVTTASTPQLGAPGTQLTLTGAGFCPGAKVAIGNPDFPATPEAIASDGTSATFRVPRGAITGAVQVLPPIGQGFSGPSMTVRSFRNTFGFSWENGDYGMRLNGGMVDELFGEDETNINVDGWLIRKPEASLFEALVNNRVPGGICFGMAYSSLEFRDFRSELASFPNSGGSIYYPGTDAWHLNSPGHPPAKGKPRGPGGPSEPLLRFATERFSLQFTDQLIPAFVNAVIGIHGTDDAINTIKAELAKGEPVIIGLINFGSLEGHAVLAYDTHQLLDGSTAVDVLNSNVPYTTGEEQDPKAHDVAEFTKSEIKIQNGNWELPQLGWSGSEASIVVYKHSELPIINGAPPKLPNVFVIGAAELFVAFGSSGDSVTQLSDGHGSLLAGGHLAPRRSWPQGIAPLPAFTSQPAPLQMVAGDPRQARALTATISRSGGGAMNMNLPGLQASLQAGARVGQVDHVSVDPRTDTIGYRTSASGTALGGTLLSAPGAASAAHTVGRGSRPARAAATSSLSDRLVRFQTTTSRGGGEQLSFPAGRELVLHHAGAAARLSLTLSAFAANGQPIAVQLPAMRLAAGETLRVAPENWRLLGSAAVRVSASVRGHTAVSRLRGRTIGRRFATVRSATLAPLGGGNYRVDLLLKLRHPGEQAWVSVAATLLRRGHAIEHARPLQIGASALQAGRLQLTLPKPLAGGRYAIKLRLLETTANGPVQGSAVLTRTLTTQAR